MIDSLQLTDWDFLTSPEALRRTLAGLPRCALADIFVESTSESTMILSNTATQHTSQRNLNGYGIRQIDFSNALHYRHFPVLRSGRHPVSEPVLRQVKSLIDESLSFWPLAETITVRRRDIARDIVIADRDGLFIKKSDHRIEVWVDVHHHGNASGRTSRRWRDDSDEDLRAIVREAVRHAESDLEAVALKPGEYDVVLAAGETAMFVHEIFGHAMEADVVATPVASEFVTVIDRCPEDRTRPDDEGTQHRPVVLIDRGRPVARLTDRTTAMTMPQTSTGNGRRQDYRHIPIPRMWETYLAAGNDFADEIVQSVKNGVYAEEVEAGHTYSDTDEVLLKITRGRRIENGKLTYPVKPLWLTGRRPSIGAAVAQVGQDLKFDTRATYCGKAGQWIPVGLGQPTVRLKSVRLGYL